jgi:hypothetical protein
MSTFKKRNELSINCNCRHISDAAEQTNSCSSASDLCWEMSTDTGWSDQVLRFCMVFPVHPAIRKDGTFKYAATTSVHFFTISPFIGHH